MSADQLRRWFEATEPLNPRQARLLLENTVKKKQILCMQCHSLKHHNRSTLIQSTRTQSHTFDQIKLRNDGLVVWIVDVTDLPGTLDSLDFAQLVGPKRVIVCINKMDVLPPSESAAAFLKRAKLKLRNLHSLLQILPLSAKEDSATVVDLAKSILKHRKPNEDVYVMGVTNVGKSQLINRMKQLADSPCDIVTSTFAGTTLRNISFSLNDLQTLFHKAGANSVDLSKDSGKLIDTPGAFIPTQLTHYLTPEELTDSLPLKQISSPRIFPLKPSNSLSFGALIRFDCLKTFEPSRIAFFGSRTFPVHVTQTEKFDALWKKHAGITPNILTPPFGRERIDAMPTLRTAFNVSVKQNHASRVWLGGLGWLVLKGSFNGRFLSPGGIGLHFDEK